MSSPGGPPRTEGSPGGPYGGYGGALQHYGPPQPGSPYGAPPPQPYGTPFAHLPAQGYPVSPHPGAPQRPAGVGTASALAVTASLLFGCGLALAWLVAYSITASFDPSAADETVIFHLAERFQLRLTQGLAVPLFGFPLLGTVAGFLVVLQRSWARLLFSAAGILALGWSAWWLRHSLGWWVPVLVYVGTACGIVWTRAASRWYAARS